MTEPILTCSVGLDEISMSLDGVNLRLVAFWTFAFFIFVRSTDFNGPMYFRLDPSDRAFFELLDSVNVAIFFGDLQSEDIPGSIEIRRSHKDEKTQTSRMPPSAKFTPSNDIEISSRPTEQVSIGSVIYIRYRDHVLFHMAEPITMSPQTRECLGWLVDQRPDYVIISWTGTANHQP